MVVANHNPANLPIQIVEVKVPHGNFKVEIFDDLKWKDVEVNVLCNKRPDETFP
jgi:hypothetical protein